MSISSSILAFFMLTSVILFFKMALFVLSSILWQLCRQFNSLFYCSFDISLEKLAGSGTWQVSLGWVANGKLT